MANHVTNISFAVHLQRILMMVYVIISEILDKVHCLRLETINISEVSASSIRWREERGGTILLGLLEGASLSLTVSNVPTRVGSHSPYT
jgi:hypothetical protein